MPDLPPLDFAGFVSPHYTPVPDAVFDVLMAYLSGAEFKVLCYIVRHTFGWRKEADAISLQQITSGIVRRDGTRLDNGTGLSKAGAVAAIKRLEELHIIEAVRRTSVERGHEPTTYRPVMALSSEQTSYPQKLDEGGPVTSQALVRSVDTQETPVQDTTYKNRSDARHIGQENALRNQRQREGVPDAYIDREISVYRASGWPPLPGWLKPLVYPDP